MQEILVVDDDASVLRATSIALEDAGYKITPTQSPEMAIELLSQNLKRFSLILMDWKLDCDLDGDMVLKILHHTLPEFNIPIVFITAHTKIASKHLLRLGAYDTLEKPITIEVLIDAVERALKMREPEDPHRRAPSHVTARFSSKDLKRQELMKKIVEAITSTNSRKEAACLLGCSRMTLWRWLKLTGLDRFLLEQQLNRNVSRQNGICQTQLVENKRVK